VELLTHRGIVRSCTLFWPHTVTQVRLFTLFSLLFGTHTLSSNLFTDSLQPTFSHINSPQSSTFFTHSLLITLFHSLHYRPSTLVTRPLRPPSSTPVTHSLRSLSSTPVTHSLRSLSSTPVTHSLRTLSSLLATHSLPLTLFHSLSSTLLTHFLHSLSSTGTHHGRDAHRGFSPSSRQAREKQSSNRSSSTLAIRIFQKTNFCSRKSRSVLTDLFLSRSV
jgi:hypothetical protein